jgi:hypothetical protein
VNVEIYASEGGKLFSNICEFLIFKFQYLQIDSHVQKEEYFYTFYFISFLNGQQKFYAACRNQEGIQNFFLLKFLEIT